MPAIIGIDLGTTFSATAQVRAGVPTSRLPEGVRPTTDGMIRSSP